MRDQPPGVAVPQRPYDVGGRLLADAAAPRGGRIVFRSPSLLGIPTAAAPSFHREIRDQGGGRSPPSRRSVIRFNKRLCGATGNTEYRRHGESSWRVPHPAVTGLRLQGDQGGRGDIHQQTVRFFASTSSLRRYQKHRVIDTCPRNSSRESTARAARAVRCSA